jgi:hypothetical membrane protein
MSESLRRGLLVCGILAPAVYVGTDLIAAARYPGYSLASQAVSELFAIGAPTSGIVVPLFTLASLLTIAFAAGIRASSRGSRARRFLSLMILGNAITSLVLWNFFPMHVRGVTPTSTDRMHALLATNPFVLLTVVAAAAAFRGGFRIYSFATMGAILCLAVLAFSDAPRVFTGEPTPWLGVTERAAQWTYDAWQVVLSVVLLRDRAG